MKKLFISAIFLLAPVAWADMQIVECFDELPGEIGIPFDTVGKVKITEVVISSGGGKAFIATEYLGSPNLQAAVYLRREKKYCAAGDLGPAIAFKSSIRERSEGLYGLVVESKSGSDRFFRTFHYHSGVYLLAACKIKPENSRMRKCTDSEK